MVGIEVRDLLDEGAWATAENMRVRSNSRRLTDEARELMLTYRSHRICTISGSSARVDGLTTVRQLLQSAPDDALCDACLAFACSVSVIEMRAWTELLLRIDPQFQRASTCASCHEIVPSTIYK